MKDLAETISALLIGVSWIAGMVLAKGFWSTLAAVCVPPYAWYLVIERGLVMMGWI